MVVRLLAVAALGVWCVVPASSAQFIEVQADTSKAWSPCIGAWAPAPVTWYIIARLGGLSASGITGAEFRHAGVPPDWIMTATPAPGLAVVDGDPLQDGVNVAFSTCQAPSSGRILLYTIHGMATSVVGCTVLTVDVHRKPSNPIDTTPIQYLCDAPLFTAVPAACSPAFINSDCIDPAGCPVAVGPGSWSRVKSLYR